MISSVTGYQRMTSRIWFLVMLIVPLLGACSSPGGLVKKDIPGDGRDPGVKVGFCSILPSSTEPRQRLSSQYCGLAGSTVHAGGRCDRKENPLAGQLKFPVPTGCLSSPFGYRNSVFHSGIDITADKGDPILACADGKVVFAGTMKTYRRYGQMVVIDHGGRVFTKYAHASRILVRPGQTVRIGEKIALVGSSGRATAPHLHLEVQVDGKVYNPVACFSSDQLRTVRVARNFPAVPMGPVSAYRVASEPRSPLRSRFLDLFD